MAYSARRTQRSARRRIPKVARLAAVTGATGFIGGHVARHLLDQGWRVRALVRRRGLPPDLASDPGLETVPGSLEDPDSLARLVEGAEVVIHAAGLIKARSRAAFFGANQAGVRRLVAAIGRPATPPRLILLSSLAAREPGISPYAASKAAGEAALEGVTATWTILRPPVVYGPGDPATLGFFRAVSKGIGPLLAPDAARLSFLHVADLCSAIGAVIDHPDETRGEIYEPDDGEPGGYDWRQFVACAGQACGTTPRLLRVPPSVLGCAGFLAAGVAALSGRPLILSPGKAREIRHLDWVSHGTSLNAATGWRARWRLGQGFAQTVAWYRAESWL